MLEKLAAQCLQVCGFLLKSSANDINKNSDRCHLRTRFRCFAAIAESRLQRETWDSINNVFSVFDFSFGAENIALEKIFSSNNIQCSMSTRSGWAWFTFATAVNRSHTLCLELKVSLLDSINRLHLIRFALLRSSDFRLTRIFFHFENIFNWKTKTKPRL